MKTEAWVFDLDGVLIDSEPIHMKAWQQALRLRGIDLSLKWYQVGIGMTDVRFLQEIAPEYGLDGSDHSTLQDKHRIFAEIVSRDGIPSCCGADEMLRILEKRFPLAIATSSSREFLDAVVRQRNWANLFRTTLSRNEVNHPKPDAEIYLKAVAGMNVAPRNCIAVEDSPTGLMSARAAGMKCIGLTTNFEADQLAEADLIIDSLADIERISDFAGVDLRSQLEENSRQ